MKESILYQTELIEIGVFAVNPGDPCFIESGYVSSPIIVFPKNSIWIQHDGSEPFVADPTLVNFYNQGQVYRRFAINQAGDYCHWFRISNELLSEVVANDKLHFKAENMPCPTTVFLQHLVILRQVSDLLGCEETDDTLGIEDQVMTLFQNLLTPHCEERPFVAQNFIKQKLLVENVKESIQADLSVNLSLKELAEIHHISPYHLSRVFKKINGYGINHYRTRQRLRSLVLELQQHEIDLIDLAFDYGFASHSHMSHSFKQVFGMTPTECQSQIYAQ